MNNTKNEMFDFLSNYISKSDVYAARAISKVSTFIYKYRKELNMSQRDFARMMGVSQGMVSKWESAEYNFTVENIANIAEKLGVIFDIEFTPESEYASSNTTYTYDYAFEKNNSNFRILSKGNLLAAWGEYNEQ